MRSPMPPGKRNTTIFSLARSTGQSEPGPLLYGRQSWNYGESWAQKRASLDSRPEPKLPARMPEAFVKHSRTEVPFIGTWSAGHMRFSLYQSRRKYHRPAGFGNANSMTRRWWEFTPLCFIRGE